jgi:hypothetical protein
LTVEFHDPKPEKTKIRHMNAKARPISALAENPLRSVPKDSDSKDSRSPYLKAVLSGANNKLISGNLPAAASTDREAALRYIRESRQLHKK